MPTVINPHFVASQGGYSRDRAAQVFQRMKSGSAMCVNDWEMARYILALSGTPILRIRCPDDDDADAKWDPIEYVDTAHTELSAAEDGIPGAALKGRIHIGNELGSASPERTAKWLAIAIRRATFHKRKAVAANWSVKNPESFMHPVLAQFGVYRAINENEGEMGYHEGAYIDPKTKQIYRTFADCVAGGCIGGYREAQRQYGFRVRITELTASKTPLDGPSTWMSDAELSALYEDGARHIWVPDGVETHGYTAFKWDRGTGFEYADNLPLQDAFARINVAYPIVDRKTPMRLIPTEGGAWHRVTELPKGVEWRNIRGDGDAGAQDVGDLRVGDEIFAYLDQQTSDGWVYLVRPRNPVAGWSLMTGVKTVPISAPSSGGGNISDALLAELADAGETVNRVVKEVMLRNGSTF